MSAFIILGILGVGLLCALTGRALIIAAAFRISWGWGIGVLLPFGPLAFRWKYPVEARPARPFQLAVIPCFLLYIVLSSGPGFARIPWSSSKKTSAQVSPSTTGYALEKPRPSQKSNSGFGLFQSAPTIEQRRVANAREFERLASKEKEFRLRKRDLLRSDVEGNATYARDLAEYNAALAEANKEKSALAAPPH